MYLISCGGFRGYLTSFDATGCCFGDDLPLASKSRAHMLGLLPLLEELCPDNEFYVVFVPGFICEVFHCVCEEKTEP